MQLGFQQMCRSWLILEFGEEVGLWVLNTHIEYLGHLGKIEVSLVSVEALELGRILIFAFFCHVTPKVGLLLGLRNMKAGVTARFGPCPPPPPSLPQTAQAPFPHQPWWR